MYRVSPRVLTCVYRVSPRVLTCMYRVSPKVLTCVYRVSASQQGGSGWGADGLHIVVVQDDAIIGKSVNVWSWNLS